MIGGRRGRRASDHQTLLPVHSRNIKLSSTVSCWYCDYKFLALNEPLFRFGRRYSRYLRVWFSMGTGFSIATLFGVTVIILCELARTLLVYAGKASPGNSFSGFSSLITGLNISLPSIGYLVVSSVICAFVHEFGHAIAAASEGIQIEYLAIFWAVLFPGALVAFNHASLLALPKVASLRIYCAGIWHNATFCAVCTLGLFLLPLFLKPLYIYGENPMVLDVPSTSPLFGYLSPSDVIYSLDDIHIHTVKDWKQTIALLTEQARQTGEIMNIEKGYCVPHFLIEESTNQTYCPDELTLFASTSCLGLSNYSDGNNNKNNNNQQKVRNFHCLDAKDVVKLKKCSYSLQAPRNTSECLCSEVEYCATPLQLPGHGWVEITYSSLECRSLISNRKGSDSGGERSCLQTFVFVGDLISMAHSIHLTFYQPRWSFDFAAYIPNVLETILMCSFHVSMVVALLNSLPVFFLDGESIVEVTVHSFGSLSPRRRRSIVRYCLLGGTFISMCFFLQMFFISVR